MNKLDLSKGISVKVENVKEAQSVLKICERLGMTWIYGRKLSDRRAICFGSYPRYLDINGVAWGLETKIKSLKDLNSLCGAKFIEIEN